MIDIEKQVAYWRDSALSDWEAAQVLLRRKLVWQGLFFVHLALEKVIKAHVCRKTQGLAPYSHNLVRLADVAELPLSPEQRRILARANQFNLEGRYPDQGALEPSSHYAAEFSRQAQEVYQWLLSQL